KFGAADTELGGQALEAVEVKGNEVHTSWAGAAGAGVGVAACLAQAPGVIRTEYASEEDLKVGGARICRSTIVLPKYEKITFGIDDTDTPESGATWVLAMKCGEGCSIDGAIFLSMRIIQLNPRAPNKTTNCTGSVISFAVLPEKKEELISYVKTFIESNSVSPDTGICYAEGLVLPKSEYKDKIKTELLTKEYANETAEKIGITFIDSANGKGRVGSLGALLWANDGVEAAGLYGEQP
ncbi:MAG TPA: tRNA(Ile2) 2-agmatinylcytidine synthetase, partial [Methanocorpusculum sp.]|nr:tRNA(Ile2) 2-agmatinylcytidine synthetase [Methanocorpusculum sp.]